MRFTSEQSFASESNQSTDAIKRRQQESKRKIVELNQGLGPKIRIAQNQSKKALEGQLGDTNELQRKRKHKRNNKQNRQGYYNDHGEEK